jgi:hypothetical protein
VRGDSEQLLEYLDYIEEGWKHNKIKVL